jgi:hypothetical protein
MTSQPELDLVNGLPTLTPTQDGDSGRYFKLAVSKDITPASNAKCELADLSMSSLTDRHSNLIIALDIRKEADEKFNVLENLMTRGSESWDGDERFVEYRKHLASVMKQVLANGMAKLPPGYTMADVEKAKGVRWARKAGCSCPCSPGFSTPLIPTKDYWRSSTRRNGRGRWSSNEAVNWVNATLVLKAGNSVAMRVARNAESLAATIEVRPINDEKFEKAKAEMPALYLKGAE